MNEYLDRIWNEARGTYGSVIIDGKDHNGVIYKGVKVVRYDDQSVRVYCTDTDFYEDITDNLSGLPFLDEVDIHLKAKYLRKLDTIAEMIQREMNNHKNHKRFVYLKKMRNEYLNKYNEISTKETTRG